MNSVFHRVSIRRFQDKTVEKEKTEAILRAAMQAPSAANQQPWEFYVVTDKEKILALSRTNPNARAAANAPAVIVAVYRTNCYNNLTLRKRDYGQIEPRSKLGCKKRAR